MRLAIVLETAVAMARSPSMMRGPLLAKMVGFSARGVSMDGFRVGT